MATTEPAEPVRPNSDSTAETGPRAEGELHQGALSDEILVGEDGAADNNREAQDEEQGSVAGPDDAVHGGPHSHDQQQENLDDFLCQPCGDDEAEEEAEPKRIAPSPTLPTAAEIEDRRICHFPYRNWCPHCVAGRALGERRDLGALGWQKGRYLIPVICIDYFYNTSGGLKVKKELKDLGYLDDEAILSA